MTDFKSNHQIFLKAVTKRLIWFCLPLLLKYLFIIIFVDFEILSWVEFFEDFIFFILVVILMMSLRVQLLKELLLVFYMLYFVLETCSYLAVSSNFTSSYMYVLIETSNDEFREFLSSYFNFKIGLFALFIITVYLVLHKKFRNNKALIKLWKSIGFAIVIVVFLKLTGLIENNAYHNVVRGIYGYYELQNGFELANNNVKVADIKVKGDNEVMVVLLGESTSRSHMQLYGYHKETSPLLTGIRDSLFIYNNVVSTDVLTLKAVPKMLTSICQDGISNLGKKEKQVINIIEVFNKAGFKSFWLSNQRPISYHDNAINKIASASNNLKFYNYKVDKFASEYDEVMVPDYVEILQQEGKKLIIIRLLGTHYDYYNRYPPSFFKFKPKNKSEKEVIINHYDNANLYNDYVVNSILQELKKLNKKSALIYLSDHGENVFDDGDFFGRVENNLKSVMLEVPFILWKSNSFQLPSDFQFDPERKFMTDHLYESIGHLFGIVHKDMSLKKSIFNMDFEERKRIILNNMDFDDYFSVQE